MRNAFLAILIASALCGCTEKRGDGPPSVNYGHVECAGCGMIVSNPRYTCAVVLPEGASERERVFDDINCMIESEKLQPLPSGSRQYVHEAGTGQWISIDEAVFVRNADVHTPMGSGLQATARSATTLPSGSLTYDQLRADAGPSDVRPGK